MGILARIFGGGVRSGEPAHLGRGKLGEDAAREFLAAQGLKFLAANYRTPRGEIDLIFREGGVLAFIEVKTRSSEARGRPSKAVNAKRKRRLTRAALDYLRLIRQPEVRIRFDIVEVLLADGRVAEIRHLPNAFPMSRPYRYG